MNHFRSSACSCLSALALLLVSTPAFAQVQSQMFVNSIDWNTAIMGTVLDDDFDSLVNVAGDLITDTPTSELEELTNPQQLTWGQLSSTAVPGSTAFSANVNQEVAVFSMRETLIFDLDPTLGQLEGLFIKVFNQDIRLSLFDGDTLVETLDEPDFYNSTADTFGNQFGWVNNTGLNITRVEITAIFPGVVSIEDLDLAFAPVAEPPAVTCFDQLDNVKSEVEALLATSTGNDALYLQCALDCIVWSQHDCFWVQPSGDRLSVYGSNVFLAGAYTVSYLEWVNDPQSDVIIDQLLDTLECLVDKEIEYAIANGGNQCYIDRAVDYADLGDIIDDDFDNQVVATLAYRLAWLNAYYSTY